MWLCVCAWVSRIPTCSHTHPHMHWVLMSLFVGSYHTFFANLLSVPAACGLEIPGHVAKRQVPILFFLDAMVRGGRVGPERNRYRLSQRRHIVFCELRRDGEYIYLYIYKNNGIFVYLWICFTCLSKIQIKRIILEETFKYNSRMI